MEQQMKNGEKKEGGGGELSSSLTNDILSLEREVHQDVIVNKKNEDDDIWGEEEFHVDGQHYNSTKQYDHYVASLNFNRMRETFVTLGIKEGVSEGVDESRQVHFEKGLIGGIREGVVCGFLVQLMSLEGDMSEERKNLMKRESTTLWKKEKMERVMEMVCVGVVEKNVDEDDEDLRVIREAIEKYEKQVELFRTTYGSILRY